MMETTVDTVPLEASEMLALRGGGDGGEAFARDLGYTLGAVLGTLWRALTHPPVSDYAYCKVGYSS